MAEDSLASLFIGLLLAVWTVVAAAAILVARRRQRRAEAQLRQARRLGRMVEESPALPLLVRADGRIEAGARLAQWLGLPAVPQFLSELDQGHAGLESEVLAELTRNVLMTQKTAAPFRMAITPRGSARSLAMRGHLADPQVSPGGAALVWVFDFSDSETELSQLRKDIARARGDFNALISLIEAAPMPMWFRRNDGTLQLVNTAYVLAVGSDSAAKVVSAGTELLETVDGRTPGDFAAAAAEKGEPIARIVHVTVHGERRAFRVSDLPLGSEGVAGYAIDIEDMEELSRSFRAFRDTQRALLDQLSAGVAQFDASRRLVFANLPFHRLFELPAHAMAEALPFERFLDAAREAGRLPEVRDFPAWRRERAGWFAASATQDEPWSIPTGTHLRMVAQPLPDGGLLLIAEDRTEQLRLSAMRDTLLRTRTATFDSLFESVAVFAPDGRLQLWNRRFAEVWGLETEFLDTHPHVAKLLERIGPRLKVPSQAKGIGNVVRSVTLDRKETNGRIRLADSSTLEFAGVPLPDGNGLLIVLDITDSQKAEEALRERNSALMVVDAIKTRFLANMSYELRTPLTTIGGFAELLEQGLGGALDESGREYVAAILSSVERLGEQIESLLDLSQGEAGQLPLAREQIELMPFVRAVVGERADRIDQAGITLDVRARGVVRSVQGDRRRLARALGHLLDNAITATPAGGRILVQVSREKQEGGGDRARIVVSDSGAGMDERTLARALDGIKVTMDGETVERRQGLGLPLARQLIDAHGGTLQLLSEPGAGTTAVIELP